MFSFGTFFILHLEAKSIDLVLFFAKVITKSNTHKPFIDICKVTV